MRIRVRRAIANPLRIEDHDIGESTDAQLAAVAEPQPMCRQRRHLADRGFERQHSALTNVSRQNAWKGAEAPVVDVYLHGGTFQGLRQTFSGTPELTEGADYVFFLWAGKSGNRQIIGLSQGVLDIHPASSASVAPLMAQRAAIAKMVEPVSWGRA